MCFLNILFQVHFIILIYSNVCSHQQEHGKSMMGLTLIKIWHLLPQQLLLTNNFSTGHGTLCKLLLSMLRFLPALSFLWLYAWCHDLCEFVWVASLLFPGRIVPFHFLFFYFSLSSTTLALLHFQFPFPWRFLNFGRKGICPIYG